MKILIVLIITFLIFTSCRTTEDEKGYEYMMDMAQPVSAEAFDPNDKLKGGKVLQKPVKGTIPRGHYSYFEDPGQNMGKKFADRAKAGQILKNPIASGYSAIQRGKELYTRFCSPCHGIRGDRQAPLADKGLWAPQLFEDRFKSIPEGEFFYVITMGNATMKSYKSQISPDDRWRIVHYIKSEHQKK